MRVASVCTGYGGIELGLALAGVPIELAYVADPDPGSDAVLAHHHPGVPNLGDITAVDWAALEPFDMLTGGYPCQPFSLAGRRKGTNDDRHLWPAIADAVRVVRPRHVLLENVPGHRSLGFGRVLGDLAGLGYVGSWRSVRASDVGAAHKRERVFIYACPADTQGNGHRDTGPPLLAGIPAAPVGGDSRALTGALLKTPTAQLAINGGSQHPDKRREGGPVPTLADQIEHLLPTPRASDGPKGGPNQRGSGGDLMLPSAVQPERWGKFAGAVTRWEAVVGHPAPDPTEPGRTGQRLAPRFVEWLMGLPAGHVTDVPGLTRNQQLRLLGNGVVPQQLAHALDALAVTR